MTTREKIEAITKAMNEISELLGDDIITVSVSTCGSERQYVQVSGCIEESGLEYAVEQWGHDPSYNALKANVNGVNILQLNAR